MANLFYQVKKDSQLEKDLIQFIEDRDHYYNMFTVFLRDKEIVGKVLSLYEDHACIETEGQYLKNYSQIKSKGQGIFLVRKTSQLWKDWMKYCDRHLIDIPITPIELVDNLQDRLVSIKMIDLDGRLLLNIVIDYYRSRVDLEIDDLEEIEGMEFYRNHEKSKTYEIFNRDSWRYSKQDDVYK